jgi:uncharacterized membrane protein
MPPVTCPECGRPLPAQAAVCPQCGFPVREPVPRPAATAALASAPASMERAILAGAQQSVTLAYALNAVGLFVPLVWIVAAASAWSKRGEVRGTWLESHCTWLVRTFAYCFALGFAGMAAWGIVFVATHANPGDPIFFAPFAVAAVVWLIGAARLALGWMRLSRRAPAYG